MDTLAAVAHNPADIQRSRRRLTNWLIPGGLILLSLIPAVGGTARLSQLAAGAEITADNARFFASPIPVVLHIISAVIYSILGALQFSPGFRRSYRGLHRMTGRISVIAGLVVAVSGLWMTHFYSWPEFDGPAVYAMRLIVGSAMLLSLYLGTASILKRDVGSHEAWMIRAYALALGAGTQALTHIPYFLFPDIQGELSRALCMGSAWAINSAVAEWVIARTRRLLPA
jgi:uncharacterized membrane protein